MGKKFTLYTDYSEKEVTNVELANQVAIGDELFVKRTHGGYTYVKIKGTLLDPKTNRVCYIFNLVESGKEQFKPTNYFFKNRDVNDESDDETSGTIVMRVKHVERESLLRQDTIKIASSIDDYSESFGKENQ